MYATPLDLLHQFDGDELGQLATPQSLPVVSEVLLELTLTEGNRDSYGDEEIAAANAAASAIQEAIRYAELEMDSYLICVYSLPVTEDVITNSPLKGKCCDIARYKLAKVHPSEEITKRYEDALRWLRDISAGKAALNNPTMSAAPPRQVFVRPSESHFNWGTY